MEKYLKQKLKQKLFHKNVKAFIDVFIEP